MLPALAGAGLAHMSSNVIVALTQERARFAEVPRSTWYALLAFWPLVAITGALVNALLLRWTGRWLGGKATLRELFTALGWSFMPVGLISPLVAAEAVALARGAVAPEEAGGLAAMAGVVVSFVFGVTAVMALVRLVIAVSEAQAVSKLRAFGNLALAALPGVLLGALAVMLAGS